MIPTRLAYVVSKHGPTIVVILLVLGTAGIGAAGWAETHPPTTEITDHEDRQTVESSLSTRAVVTGETALYREGMTVENQPVYLTAAAPNLTLALETRLPSETKGSVDQRLELVYTATRNGKVFWKRTETLSSETARDGRMVVTEANVSMRSILRQVGDYQSELGSAATVSVSVRTDVEYSLQRYEGAFSETAAVQSGSRWYSVPTDTASRTHSTPETRTVELSVRDKPRFFVPGILGVVSLVAGLVVAGGYYGGLRHGSATLETDVHHERYVDWITRGTLPQDDSLTAVRTDSLEGLVDVAIDTGERVIYDPERDRYAVLHGQTGYYHDPDR